MKTNEIVLAIAQRPSNVELVPQKGFAQLRGPGGAKLYVRNPDAQGEFSIAHVSHWGYGGLPKALALPADAVRPVDDNGAVSLEVDLGKAPAGWLARAIAHLEAQDAQPDPRRSRTRTKRASRPTLADMIAAATAPSAASADASTDASTNAGSDVPVITDDAGEETTAEAIDDESEDDQLARMIREEEAASVGA